ncbi:MAG: AAA family ATPase [Planctomycetota bacterium]|nr:AAA family ATPase [Planctomycetota bacterium]
MLTRLAVHGFKNLVNVAVHFGPFTCIAGANGVGKSNLFDAITFLRALADRPLMEAASAVRDESSRSTPLKSLFTAGATPFDEMMFTAEMIVPQTSTDDLGQPAKAAITFLRYTLVLGLHEAEDNQYGERLIVKREELSYINLGEAKSNLSFEHTNSWRRSAVKGVRRGNAFISTGEKDGQTIVRLHQDGNSGRAREAVAVQMPRTVLSTANAGECPTALLARREMQSWRLLQLEPSALRNPDSFNAPVHISPNGAHLASTLYSLSRKHHSAKNGKTSSNVTQAVANRLSDLVEDVAEVRVDEDAKRELRTLEVVDRSGNVHAARALSDGTLRFLALSILEQDPESRGLLCFEEPENGINPKRIESMLKLLKDLAVDVSEEIGPDNPLRQVIINTHSPAVVANVFDSDLLMACPTEHIKNGNRYKSVAYTWLPDTWRSEQTPDVSTMAKGELFAYLEPLAFGEDSDFVPTQSSTVGNPQRKQSHRVKTLFHERHRSLPFPEEQFSS